MSRPLTNMIAVLYPAVSLVSINPECSHNLRPRTARSLAQAAFAANWRWQFAPTGGGEPSHIDTDLRLLILRMSVENPLWGAPRIHGELLLKLGFEVRAIRSVAK